MGQPKLLNKALTIKTDDIELAPSVRQLRKSFPLIRFGIITDSHFAHKPSSNGQFFSHSLYKMNDFIRQMNLEEVDFIMHLGDLKDEEYTKNEKNTLAFLKEIEIAYQEFEGHTYHCVGNHDLDSITKEQFLNGISNTNISKYKSYYSFERSGILFVALDTNFDDSGKDHYYKKGGDWQQSFVSKAQLKWLEAELEASAYPVIVFCHHPLFKYISDEKKYHIVNHTEVRQALEHSGKVLAVFQGHVHEKYRITIENITYLTMPSILEKPGIENNRYALIEIGHKNLTMHQIGPPDEN